MDVEALDRTPREAMHDFRLDANDRPRQQLD